MLTDAEFERTLQGFSPEAQDAMRRDRDRHIAEAKTDIRRGKPVVTRGVAALEDAEDLRAHRQALHNGATVTSQPKGAAAPTAPASTLNRFATFIGEKFRDFEEAALQAIGKDLADTELKIDGKLAAMRRDFIQSVRSKAAELARGEVENRIAHEIEKALKDHRQERIALAREVERLRDEVERLKQGYRS